MVKTLKGAKRFITTPDGGPNSQYVATILTRSLSTGKAIDECDVQNAPDEALHRKFATTCDIEVILVMEGAIDMYERRGCDIAEICPQPRVAP